MINHGFWGIPIVELPCLHIPWHQRFSGLPWQAWLWQLYRWHQAIWVLFHWDETEIRMRWIPSGSLIYLDVSIILDVHWAKHMNFGKDAILCYLSLVLSYPGPHQEAWYHVAAWGLATTCDMGKEHGDPVVLSRVAAAVHSIPGFWKDRLVWRWFRDVWNTITSPSSPEPDNPIWFDMSIRVVKVMLYYRC
jgi:hypothetical protein